MRQATLAPTALVAPDTVPLALQSAFVVSYYAYPDPAVGAMRMSELAAYLAKSGVAAQVFGRTYDREPRGSELAADIARVSIEDPIPWSYRILGTLLASQRKQRQSTKGKDSGAPPATESPPTVPWGTNEIGWFRFNYYRVTGAVDDQKKWSVNALRAMLRAAKRQRPGAIIASGPPFSPIIAATLASRWLDVPLILDMRDPWSGRPAAPPGIDRGLRRWLDRTWERRAVTRARAIVVTSTKLAETLAGRYPAAAKRIHVIPNGYDARHIIDTPPPSARLDMLYAGTIYLNRNPLPLLEAIAALVARPDVSRNAISLTFVGSCDHWRDVDLRRWTRERSLEDVVQFLPPVGPSEVRRLTEASSVLINLSQGQPSQVPAKLFEQLAAKRTLLLFAESDSESAAVARGVASVIRLDDDKAAVEQVLEELYRSLVVERKPALSVANSIQRFSRASSNARLLELMNEAARNNR